MCLGRPLTSERMPAAAKLQEHSEAFAARLIEISDQSVRALHTAQSHAAAAESEALRVREMLVRGVQGEAEKRASALERQAAQVQARGPAGPSLSEVLGSSAAMPEAQPVKKGGSTFDTLTGNPLTR